MDNILFVDKLNVYIKNKHILKDLSFDIAQGEIIGLLGPNGSGKTTTIKAMAGLVKKKGGKIKFCNYDIHEDFEKYIRYISFGFDRANYYPNLTGYENLYMYANVYKKSDSKEILRCAKDVGLDQRINDKVSTYSFGMRQRLNFAKSLLVNAKLIVLDEPFNGIDPAGIVEMRNLILSLKEKGTSFIISSHLLGEIENISDRVLFYREGRIVEEIVLSDYHEYNHYIKIVDAERMDEVVDMFSQYRIEKMDKDIIKLMSSGNELSEIIRKIYDNKVEITYISSKKAIEDLYLNIVGGGQNEQ